MATFKGLLLTKDNEQFKAELADIDEKDMPEGDVVVRVEYSTLNYKDALAITNKSPIVRKWPMVAGIDAAGEVEESTHPLWKKGDRVVINGWGLSETHWGGLARKIRVKGEWCTRLPVGMTTRQAMAIGTAGYTAMLCVMELANLGVGKDRGPIVVTGATGGVGSIAIAILARRGYRVAASTGKMSEEAYLKSLGAAEIIDRATLSEPGKPLQKERWGGAVDSVGSHTLANVCAQTVAEGVVTACGLAQGMDFPVTVAPFILRGVTLRGINSVTASPARRQKAWDLLSEELDKKLLDGLTSDIGITQAIAAAPAFIASKVKGRIVVDVNR
jgi:putative YhdH/YhfP family quinone oxidoreductase